MTNFGTLLSYEQPTKYIVNDTNYKPTYKTPVLTAGKSFILGYTNETDNIFDDLPVIIFDDFTTESKFVDFPFKVKSSAMKILHINQDLVLPKYAFYLMQATEIDHDNHQRYWISTYSQEIISLPPLSEQIKIIETVENLFDLTQSVETNSQNLKNSIKTTKSKILDLAIRGKLVPQDQNDESASVLLERIRAEKEELIKQGKIKRDKKESVIFKGDDNSYYRLTADNKSNIIDIPFNIPDNWEWCNLSMIGSTNIGLTYKPVDIVADGTMVLRSSNIINGKIDLSDLVRVNSTIRENQYIQENDILICARNGSKALVGKCAIYENANEKASFGAFMAVYRSRFFKYVYYFLNSEFFRNTFSNDDSKQINQLTQDMIKNTTIPLPPLAEQKRIVEAIETAFAQLDEILNSIS